MLCFPLVDMVPLVILVENGCLSCAVAKLNRACAALQRPYGNCPLEACCESLLVLLHFCCYWSQSCILKLGLLDVCMWCAFYSWTSWLPLDQKATQQSIGGKPHRADGWREGGQRPTDSEERINKDVLSTSQDTNRAARLGVSFYTIMSVDRRWFALRRVQKAEQLA